MDRRDRILRAAGILEGEGTFGASRGGIAVSCEMTDKDVIEELASLFGGRVVEVPIRNVNWKQTWRWKVTGSNASATMREILPHMFERRTQRILEILEPWEKMNQARDSRKLLNQEVARKYLNGEGTLRALSEEHGMSRQTILNHVTELKKNMLL